MPQDSTATCPSCGEQKPIDAFLPKRVDRNSYGICRECNKAKCRANYLAKRDAYLERNRRWREMNPGRDAERSHQRYEQNKEQYAEAGKKWRAENPEKMAAYSRDWFKNNRQKAYESARQWELRNPERVKVSKRAGGIVFRAIERGELVRPRICEECGVETPKIQGAHSDYGRPLDVRWLCPSCHARWDHQEPKTL